MGVSLRVSLVSTWETNCGIAQHSALLKEAVEAADPSIQISVRPDWLDPGVALASPASLPELVHLNWQAALHSRWTLDWIARLRTYHRCPITATVHDTGVPNSDQVKALVGAVDAAGVHEPCDDLPAEKSRHWRRGGPSVREGWTRLPRALAISDRPV